MPESRRPMPPAVLTLTCAVAIAIRVRGISDHFLLLGDQIRDWGIALGPLKELPLIGPATHVHGYTIGPAFYWILWTIRVIVGPWFQNLPHAGGIGQAILQSAADALLLLAVWRRTGSLWLALTTIVVLVTASFDLGLAAIIWNPVVGSTLAKIATALVLLDWHRRSPVHVASTAAIAWSAVHAYTGAVFVAVSVLAALLVDPLIQRQWGRLWRHALAIALVVAALQVPYLAHQMTSDFRDSGMAAVTGSVGTILSGADRPRFEASASGYVAAFTFIECSPWNVTFGGWLLVVSGLVLAVRRRHDPALLLMTLLPQVMAVVGYAFFLGGLDHYYYLSLMPAAVLTVILGVTSIVPQRAVGTVGIALLVGALAIVPARLRFATTMLRMPEYGAIVQASRKLVRERRPMRAINTAFRLPPTGDAEVVYGILGGRLDRQAPWVGIIAADGEVTYRKAGD